MASVLAVAPPTLVSASASDSAAWNVSGDFRLRYENTNNQAPGTPLLDSRNREVVRFRAGVTRVVNERVTFGARLTTGEQNDPNTADVTLGSFVDDLEVSLDRLYLGLAYRDLTLVGGKFANPFRATDLVWDGDVNPQGVSASYKRALSDRMSTRLAATYAIVDEHSNTTTPDSDMKGGQVELSARPAANVGVTLAAGYYDYRIQSLSNADAGDTRSNYLKPGNTAYVSDFDLLDAIVVLDLPGFGSRYPVRVVGDYVKNLGAEVDEDQGFGIDVFIGRTSATRDARLQYGYSEAETDAVLAAFSHDNTTLATNYRQHTLAVDYVVLKNTTLNATWYAYRKHRLAASDSDEYISRLRLNAVVTF